MRVLPRLLLLAAVFLSVPTCAHVPPQVIATSKDCGNQVTHAVAGGIRDDVSHALLCDFSNTAALPACLTAQLVAIAARAGWAAVDCVVTDVWSEATVNSRASMDPVEIVRARRAGAVAAWRTGPGKGPGTASSGAP